jgi:teichuronic acid exporter
MTLKDKAINGVLWNSIGNFSAMGIEFIIGIILARILSPSEFGLIGTITVVIALSQVFVNSGFSQAIVRKQNCTQTDYSTAFFFNFAVGILIFLLLLFTAQPISVFFENSELKPIIQVLGFGLIISSLTLIQQAKLTKRIDFKLQTKISITASTLSGLLAVYLAYNGFGVWSLVAKQLANSTITSIFLWIFNRWKPSLVFSKQSFKELFGFGSKLLLSGLISTFFQNINYLIIAKYFSAQDLGYFTRAELFKNLPSQNVSNIVTAVGYPVLAKLQGDSVRMKSVFRDMMTKTFFIVIILMVGMAVTANALILTLLGDQWLPSVPLLQMLCVVGIMLPLNTMNINILNVVGRSDLYLKLQTIVQLFVLPNIFIGVFFGIKALILGMIGISVLGYIMYSHESNKILNYPIKEQLRDVFPSLLIAIAMGIPVFFIGYFSSFDSLITLIIQVMTGIIIVVGSGEIFSFKEYIFIKTTIIDKFKINIKE